VGFITNIDSRGLWRDPDEVLAHHNRPKSGHITCYLNRTYHVLLTIQIILLDRHIA
jgi:hypothetical protein